MYLYVTLALTVGIFKSLECFTNLLSLFICISRFQHMSSVESYGRSNSLRVQSLRLRCMALKWRTVHIFIKGPTSFLIKLLVLYDRGCLSTEIVGAFCVPSVHQDGSLAKKPEALRLGLATHIRQGLLSSGLVEVGCALNPSICVIHIFATGVRTQIFTLAVVNTQLQ